MLVLFFLGYNGIYFLFCILFITLDKYCALINVLNGIIQRQFYSFKYKRRKEKMILVIARYGQKNRN